MRSSHLLLAFLVVSLISSAVTGRSPQSSRDHAGLLGVARVAAPIALRSRYAAQHVSQHAPLPAHTRGIRRTMDEPGRGELWQRRRVPRRSRVPRRTLHAERRAGLQLEHRLPERSRVLRPQVSHRAVVHRGRRLRTSLPGPELLVRREGDAMVPQRPERPAAPRGTTARPARAGAPARGSARRAGSSSTSPPREARKRASSPTCSSTPTGTACTTPGSGRPSS
jgi:hypothetical protein